MLLPLMLALTAAAAVLPASPSASIDKLDARWVVHGELLEVELDGQTDGWVLIGFNSRDELAGSRLFFARMVDGVPSAEEHIADPPNHARRKGSEAGVVVLDGDGAEGRTRVRFTIQLGDAGGVPLKAGGSYYVTLAWSHSDDLQHHSALRRAERRRL